MSESPEVTQPPEVPLLDRLRELDRRIAGSVEQVVRELHHELGERVRRNSQDLLRLVEELKPAIPSTFLASDDLAPIAAQATSSAGRRAVHELLEAVERVDAATTQADVLAALLEEGRRFASRTAFFLIRAGVSRGWASRGFANDTDIQSTEIAAGGLAALDALGQGRGPVRVGGADRTELARWLGAAPGSEGVVIPFVLRGKLGGALYADRVEGAGGLDVESLQLLAHNAAQALETLPVRGATGSPTLRTGPGRETMVQPLQPWEPGAAAPPAVAATVATVAAVAAMPTVESIPVEIAPPEPPAVEAFENVEPEPVIEEPVVEEPAAEAVMLEEPAFEEPAFEAAEEPEILAAEAPIFEPEPPAVEPAEVELFEAEPAAPTPEPIVDFAAPEPATEPVLAEPPAAAEELEVFEPLAAPSMAEAAPAPQPEIEDYELAEPDVETYGFATDKPTREVEPEADLWPADEEEMPAVDFAPEVTEVTPLEPATVELVEEAPELAEPEMPEVAYPDFPVGQQTVRLDISAFQTPAPAAPVGSEDPTRYHSTAEVPTWEVEEPAPVVEPTEYASDLDETNAYEPITEAVPTTPPVITSEDPTVLGSRASLGIEPPAPAAPVPAAPVLAAPPASPLEPEAEPAGSTQVLPPSDVQGPGLAFAAGGGAAGHEALHEEARRLARLLVSEIKLYNEEIIEEGKREGNIYDRLREDIDRSRQMYEERIDPRIRGTEDYFYQELVQRLAGGNARLLGM